ncbi:uncharacterized protein SPPG_08508 [Spizellomyces punctatus DAOM BR117]|uniref:Uncharacterized protein n=1 Tax=Spizellomyces punctatus (strain DAOM BR117) TaxID=645134 RepID=A0A0L0H3S5_SPIPD|nr:uncharacterized protein SPPG_08508 [Spizellomyces punctatus DAOM BR117]KNC96120.1 hypothetical protein SPPG_08508 [Spizellomyces punctatus DAOM BR117]|eukprot:XP_016604160.1 hypothetical protein SPPG_08508 [Spizellomyces punctatus DAOM BR117]
MDFTPEHFRMSGDLSKPVLKSREVSTNQNGAVFTTNYSSGKVGALALFGIIAAAGVALVIGFFIGRRFYRHLSRKRRLRKLGLNAPPEMTLTPATPLTRSMASLRWILPKQKKDANRLSVVIVKRSQVIEVGVIGADDEDRVAMGSLEDLNAGCPMHNLPGVGAENTHENHENHDTTGGSTSLPDDFANSSHLNPEVSSQPEPEYPPPVYIDVNLPPMILEFQFESPRSSHSIQSVEARDSGKVLDGLEWKKD